MHQNETYTEIEDLSDFFHGWHLEVIQLAARRKRTTLWRNASHSLRILQLQAGHAFAMRGLVRKDCTCVMLSASPLVAARMVGRPLLADELVLATPGAKIDLYIPADAVLCVLILESCQLREFGARHALRICSGSDVISEDVAILLRYLRGPKQRIDIATLTIHLRQALAASKVFSAGVANTSRISAVVRACRLLEKTFPAPMTLGELSRLCGVATRTLEYGFKQMYDTTPVAFIKSQRLTRSRMALLNPRIQAPISATAQAHGFTHMGQYSSDYRRLFGESPSMTIMRGQSPRQSKQA